MYYTKIDIKLKRRISTLYDEQGQPKYRDYHQIANDLFEKYGRQRFLYLGKKILRRGEFTLYAASKTEEPIEPYAEEFIRKAGGDPAQIVVTESTQEEFVDLMKRARSHSYLRNGKEICNALEIETT